MILRALTLASLAALSTACVGTTGGDLFEFEAYAGGPAEAEGGGYTFQNGRGYAVTLDRAELHIGAVYLNRSVPASVSRDTTCTLPGIYLAEVPAGIDLDLLSGRLEPFPVAGDATEGRARTAEVWLMGGDVNADDDPTPILVVAGTATRDGEHIAFDGTLTIGSNRVTAPDDPAQPGAEPICKQRIVSPIPVDLQLAAGGRLVVRVNPRGLFANVDFSTLPAADKDGVRRFSDAPTEQASINLYNGLRAATGTYGFDWVTGAP